MSGRAAREQRLLLAPAALLLGAAVVAPIVRLVWLSLQRSEAFARSGSRFAGLESYARAWQDGRWWAAIAHTSVFAGTSVALELGLGIAFALLLDCSFPGRRWVRAVVLVPWALPSAVMALAWGWIFNDSFGVLNDLLTRFGLVHGPVAWLGQPGTAMAAMVVADVWKTTPFMALLILAGLQIIGADVYEAAKIDGANRWQQFRYVTWPLVTPTTFFVLIISTIALLVGAFDQISVMTNGGPLDASNVLVFNIYRTAFIYFQMGYASAMAYVLFLVVLGFTTVQWVLQKRWVHY